MGRALKKTVCVTALKNCPRCLLYRSCPYPYIFETPPPENSEKMRRYRAAPHPFLLELPLECGSGLYELGLTLVGRAAAYLPYLVYAFQLAGKRGLGKARVPMILVEVVQAQPVHKNGWVPIYEPGGVLKRFPPSVAEIPAAPTDVHLRLKTPLRLRHAGRLVNPQTFRFSDLLGALLRRVSLLTYFHTDRPLETDFAGIMSKARRVEPLSVGLEWKDWTRYSSRQETTMQMGGLIGEMVIELKPGTPFWPYLFLGQWVHAGKATSMGLGQYEIEPASLPESKTGRI